MSTDHVPMTDAERAAVIDRYARSPDRRVELIAGLYRAAEILTDRFLDDHLPFSAGYEEPEARQALWDLETFGRQAGLAVEWLQGYSYMPPELDPKDSAEGLCLHLAGWAARFGGGVEADPGADAPAVVEGGGR